MMSVLFSVYVSVHFSRVGVTALSSYLLDVRSHTSTGNNFMDKTMMSSKRLKEHVFILRIILRVL
jgi:hypothetical protein